MYILTIGENIDYNLDVVEINTCSKLMLELDIVFIYRSLGFISLKEFDKAHKLYKSLTNAELNIIRLFLDYPKARNIRTVFRKEMNDTHRYVKKMKE